MFPQKIKEDAEATYWTERAKLLARYEKAMKATVLPWINLISSRINFFPKLLPENKISIIVNGVPANKITVLKNNELNKEIAEKHNKKHSIFNIDFDNLFLDDEIVQKAIDVTGTYKNKKNDDMDKQLAHKQMKAIEQNLKKIMAKEEKFEEKFEEKLKKIEEILDKIVLKDTVNAEM
jgi:hypothetical protein